MSLIVDKPTRTIARRGGLAVGLLALVFPLAACGDDEPTAQPSPTNISIAPSSAEPTSSAPGSPAASPTAGEGASTPVTAPSTTRSERIDDIVGAIEAAESAVADSTVVEVSKDDDDGRVTWEITVRVGDNGRELRINAADGSVISNTSDRLDQSQLGAQPKVTVREAIKIAEKRVPKGEVTDAELGRENGQRVWKVTVDVGRDDEWELEIDASSGKVVREERD